MVVLSTLSAPTPYLRSGKRTEERMLSLYGIGLLWPMTRPSGWIGD